MRHRLTDGAIRYGWLLLLAVAGYLMMKGG